MLMVTELEPPLTVRPLLPVTLTPVYDPTTGVKLTVPEPLKLRLAKVSPPAPAYPPWMPPPAATDTVPALRTWRASGLRVIVVSNWDVSLHDVLRRTRLDVLLDGVVCSAEVGRSKPDPATFVAALELAGVAAEEAVHIGDSVEEDVAGARAAGIEPWLLVRDAGRAQAPAGPRTLASLREA